MTLMPQDGHTGHIHKKP